MPVGRPTTNQRSAYDCPTTVCRRDPRTYTWVVSVARFWVVLAAFAIAVALGLADRSPRAARAQLSTDERVRSVLSAMSPAERVGQLFLVPFSGATVEEGSQIARLIDERRVGGVVLDPRAGNFRNAADAPEQVARLTNALQSRWDAGVGPFVPLLVVSRHLGDGPPDTDLYGGMTMPPSQMSLGATWEPVMAERVGEFVGRELAAVGVNLILGPSLDVAAVPRPSSSGDLGNRVYGGSPSWVALFGQHYARGVHRGGGGRVGIAAASFPGLGGADRSPAEEGAVVESSLEELAASDLVPFVALAAGDPDVQADALVSSHVRYRAVQQQADRPFSLDTGGMRYLWSQTPALLRWREELGVVVSSGLGLPAVRRYLDAEQRSFNGRRAVGEALAAGNDLMLLTDFGPAGEPSAGQANVEDAIGWLVERYGQDDSVREAVDAAARRVLALKLRLYGSFDLESVLVDPASAPAVTGLGGEVVAEVAATALTLIAPGAGVPVPQPGDRIVFVVDARETRECEDCPVVVSLDPEGLVGRVRQRYGPTGTGRLQRDEDVAAITFTELKSWLQDRGAVVGEDTPTLVAPLAADRLAEVTALVDGADWLVFAMRDVRPAEAPGSDALKLYLRSASAESGEPALVAIAFGAPYYLDTTEIAKLQAYYAVYGRGAAFLDVAARALFGDAPPGGASPVSVPGAGYDLSRRLEPALDQDVTLELVGRDPARAVRVGDTLTVRTSAVVDANGHPAPDGTQVTFRRFDVTEGLFLADVVTSTSGGRVTEAMRAERPGELEINAVFENGLRSRPLSVQIEPADALVEGLLPDVPLPGGLAHGGVRADWAILVLSLTLVLLAGVIVYGADAESATPEGQGRLVLMSLAWGLAGYLLVVAGGLGLGRLPGGLRLWPAGWPEAYLAPVLSFAFALLPALPTAWRSLRASLAPPGR